MQFDDNKLNDALNAWRDSVHQQADRPDWFWARQRARVTSEVRRPQRSMPRFAWAGIAATVALALGLMLPARNAKITAPLATPPAAAQNQISDHDLMVSLERTMNAAGPSSLAPASLLAEDMDQALDLQVQKQKSKEKRYEN